MTTISTTIAHNIYYGTGETYPSPLTITSTGAVITAVFGTNAVYGAGGGTLSNFGTITGSAANDIGVEIGLPGGTVINAGLIQGYNRGVYTEGSSFVTNSGRILATGSSAEAAAELRGGGTLFNSGSIINSARTEDGVRVDAAGATVSNSGLIQGYAEAVGMQQAGIVLNTNGAVIRSTATGVFDDAVFEGSGAGTVTNQGTIITNASGGNGIYLESAGGSVINSGLIQAYDYAVRFAAAGYISNTGTILTTGGNGRAAIALAGDTKLVNQGSIISSAFAQSGINGLAAGDTVTNSGLIQGYVTGLDLSGLGTVVNSGTIVALDRPFIFGQADVMLPLGGSVTNTASGYINHGVFLNVASDGVGAAGTVVNAGTINGGVYINSNFSPYGVTYTGSGTVFNAGTIGNSPFAIYFAGTNALVVLEHGYALNGIVDAAGKYPHTVELMSNASAPVTVNFSPGEFRNFGTAGFYPGMGNAGTLAFASASDAFGTGANGIFGTIVNFTAAGDVVDLKFISDTSGNATAVLNPLNDQLTVTGDNGSVVLQLDKSELYTGFHTTPDGTGTDVDVGLICFCRGTLIRTPRGDVPVEALKPDDLITLADGRTAPIVWIGQGRVMACRGRRSAATPVIVRKGALAENVPHSDLRVTKGHAFYIDDVLIPVEFLVNHRSIHWDDRAQEVSIYHIELRTHDILLANGAPAESYRDDGNRWLFQNANSAWDAPPKPLFAPVLTGGPVVDSVWRRLLDRTGPRLRLPLTDDPDLHLMVDGRRLDPAQPMDGVFVFDLMGVAGTVRIVSRAAVPQELGLARDPRLLGVGLRLIAVRSGSRFRIVQAGDERLTDGFHAFEAEADLRWTDGDAGLPDGAFEGMSGRIEVVLTVASTTHYVDEGRQLLTA